MNETCSIEYLSSAIQRIENGTVDSRAGSHIAGIFGRAANDFEKLIQAYLAGLLQSCGLKYDVDIRATIKGPIFAKLTLGNCIAAIKEVSRLRHECVIANIPAGGGVEEWLWMLSGINNAWVDIKHGEDVGQSILLNQMRTMLMVHRKLRGYKS